MHGGRVWVAAAILVAGCAHGGGYDAEAELRAEFEALDADGDGRLSLAELPAPIYALSDADGDGELSRAELAQFFDDPVGASRIPLPANVRLIEDVPYAHGRDPRQRLDIYLPRQPSVSGPLPVIAYVHGGAWRMGSRVMARSQVLPLVDSGRFAVVSIGYRLTGQAPWPAQIHDVKAGIRWIRAHADDHGFDPDRICAMGGSAGGHLAAHLGTSGGVAEVAGRVGHHRRQRDDVQCAIDFFGPADFSISESPELRSPGRPSAQEALFGAPAERVPEVARQASPVHYVDSEDPPFLIVHGSADPVVPIEHSVRLERALRAAGVPVIFQVVEGGGHADFGGAELERRVVLFLERSLYDPATEVPGDPLQHPADTPMDWR